VYKRADGARIMRTTTTTIGRDGRVSQSIEEHVLEGAHQQASEPGGGREAVANTRGLLRDALRTLAAPVIAAASSVAVRVVTRALVTAGGAFLRAIVRRLLGGR
jgi:hypothetical protein